MLLVELAGGIAFLCLALVFVLWDINKNLRAARDVALEELSRERAEHSKTRRELGQVRERLTRVRRGLDHD